MGGTSARCRRLSIPSLSQENITLDQFTHSEKGLQEVAAAYSQTWEPERGNTSDTGCRRQGYSSPAFWCHLCHDRLVSCMSFIPMTDRGLQ
ncbi:hypothetical protein Naga_100133g19 [Nannochloropsis gaditana]|uniref:Uncharacterized protein n=1 Tax=Nannochloropsis gaditana TaxID=72520 RepID=W7TRM9_9STRA|nr:hypothetical protein Naga_100133g19 [Nannochloropsis gaditana]